VKIVGGLKLIAFGEKHPPARNALNRWAEVVEEASWKSPAEMKQSFGSADMVGRQTVFNIGGNKYRLIAVIEYVLQIVLVQEALTHADYEKGAWKR
jgi:mRNA interferase HigB